MEVTPGRDDPRLPNDAVLAQGGDRLSHSTEDLYTVFFEPFICRNNGKVIQPGGRNDEAVARVIVDRWELGRDDADIPFERKNGQAMMRHNFLEPFLGGT